MRPLLITALSFLVSYVEERPWRPIQSPNKRKKEESEMLRGERNQIKFIDLRFERWQVVRFRKARLFAVAEKATLYKGMYYYYYYTCKNRKVWSRRGEGP